MDHIRVLSVKPEAPTKPSLFFPPALFALLFVDFLLSNVVVVGGSVAALILPSSSSTTTTIIIVVTLSIIPRSRFISLFCFVLLASLFLSASSQVAAAMASSNNQHLVDTNSEASCNSTRYFHSTRMTGIKLIMLWLILILSLRLGCSTNAPDVEGEALVDLLNALNDSRNSITDWNLNFVSPCYSWSHVTCRDGHVVALSLASHGFSGTLSPSISKLKFLANLELQDNDLSGPLPNYISSLLSLRNLNLARNQLTGTIPNSWVQLSKLKHLDLSSNALSGRIPPRLFSVPTYNFTGTHLTCGLSSDLPCVVSSSPPDKTQSSKREEALLITGLCCASILLLVGALLTYWYLQLRKFENNAFSDVDGEDERRFSFGHVKRFSWREIQIATGNFNENNVIGSGGFGKVYRGILTDGTTVAVKRLVHYHSSGGEDAFLREVQLISAAVHKNLLRLIGFCTTSSEKILIYPFMQNLSVANCLRDLKPGEKGLDWPTRKKVAFGTARGLEYLHEHCNPKIIHRDLKAANVLLDENFEAVLGDFGLAKLVDAKLTHVTTRVRGTMGHIAPEYVSTGKSSEKTDVFGYGITLLELVTGQRAIDFSRLEEGEEVLLIDHIKKLLREKRLYDIVDSSLSEEYDGEEVEMMVRVALLCTQDRPEDRPRMAEVVTLLGGVGLAERWEEWEKVEEQKNGELLTSMMAHHRFAWGEESLEDNCAVHLSSPR